MMSIVILKKKNTIFCDMDKKTIIIRNARVDDLPGITEIYNEAVVNTLSTFHLYPRSLDDQKKWFEKHGEKYPLLIAEEDESIVAWASLSPYSEREGYQYTVSDSIYVRQGYRQRGIGYDLLHGLISEAQAIIARVNIPSIKLHEKLGFICRGVLPEAGYKFGKWVDICLYQKML
jgi:phosphinothricin acetyltransferase